MLNFIYPGFKELGAAYHGALGLERALAAEGVLNYAYDTLGDKFIDEDRVSSYPILYMKGHNPGMMKYIELGKGQFKACFNPENFFNNDGKMEASAPLIREREKLFNLMFTFAEADVAMYRIPTKYMEPWADTTVIYPKDGVDNLDLVFIGGVKNRESFFSQDEEGIIQIKRTDNTGDAYKNACLLNDLINKYMFHVVPFGRCVNSMPGRVWEILAAKRVCFAYLNKDTMYESSKCFQDGIDLIYWQTYDELIDKYKFYAKNFSLAEKIAEHGYQIFLAGHTQKHRVKFIYDSIMQEVGAKV
jgi:hypothetical protein